MGEQNDRPIMHKLVLGGDSPIVHESVPGGDRPIVTK